MADKKDPPFFNEDNAGPFHFKPTFFETMELLIETLTGTCFELRVSPFETVVSVKAKIQRLEGIPVAQQHLIWNNMELEDEYRLHDYNIAEGCTLKLVLAMRGGPINTRRVPMDDPVKEATEYVEAGREEAWEKSQLSKQVTYLVYREGDQLNFFRVVDRGDGTLTPVSESISGGSVYNLYAEEEEEEEGDGAASGQQALENSITMSKMKLLKAKMESMNLNKKPKKTAKLKPRPPGGARPCSSNLAPSRHHLPFRVLPQIGQPLAPKVQLPLARDQQPTKVGPSHLPTLSPLPFPAPAPTSQDQEEEESWECPTLGKIRPPPKVSRLEVGGPKLLKDHLLPPLSVLPSRGVPDGSMEEAEPKPANGSNGGPSSSIRRMGTPTYLLPLVKTPVFPKKKSSKHCFLCGKKTGLATSFECRCGNNFCASHRYAETHACSYDYKGAGRRFLQETNPIITAPKLPKI